ncbi:biopolymer transporter ExbD [Sphingomonas piscis]|uniref:Biopolymer transporter ExbD n=1 Tax=Sphingomonas piscis TaxID=2714943 RepID=A0A6G7YRY9_9SPHN|nr:biopolymer transporter ExbD [Sphingomonas piscis]QIK79499.1 biopolymer transporter ExbD [Sphingomonas piscis]
MAMSVGKEEGDDVPMSDINTTPLVDVMLVLLIIFLITVPVVLQSVPIQLPTTSYEVTETKKENVNLSVRGEPDGTCGVYWQGVRKMGSKELTERAVKHLEDQIKAVGGVDKLTEENMPEAHIRGDKNSPYKCIGGAVYTMQRAGFARVGFISEPTGGN